MTITATTVIAAMKIMDRGDTAQEHAVRNIRPVIGADVQAYAVEVAMRDAMARGWVEKRGAMHWLTPAGQARVRREMVAPSVRASAMATARENGIIVAPIGDVSPVERAARWKILALIEEADGCIMSANLDALVRDKGMRPGEATRGPLYALEHTLGLISCETREVMIDYVLRRRRFVSLTDEGRRRLALRREMEVAA